MAVGRCPQCDGKLDIPKKHSGKQICCAHCQHIFIAPSFPTEPANPAQASAMASAVNSLPLPSALQSPSQSDKSQSNDSVDQSAWPPGMSAPTSPAKPAVDRATTQSSPGSPQTNPATSNPAAATPASSAVTDQTTATMAKVSSSAAIASAQTDGKTGEQKERVPDTAPATKQPGRTVKIRRPKTEARSPEAKLPSLSLIDKPRRKQIEMPGWKSNPIFLGVLFCVSMIASAAILLVDVEPPKQQRKTNSEARVQLQAFYEVRPGSDPEPYQVELRSAQLAHSRGDRNAELQHYRNVMTYLRAEDRNPYTGLTGSSERDAELESYLSGLLRDPD